MDQKSPVPAGSQTSRKALQVYVPTSEMHKLRHTEVKVLTPMDTHQVCVTPKPTFVLCPCGRFLWVLLSPGLSACGWVAGTAAARAPPGPLPADTCLHRGHCVANQSLASRISSKVYLTNTLKRKKTFESLFRVRGKRAKKSTPKINRK